MGSHKKRKEKQKDFNKAKLKVGKAKAKPNNFTDTSFVAKTISLPTQSISRSLDSDTDLIKRLTLVKHHSPHTRKETLIFIQQHLPNSPTLYKQILNLIIPLMIDQSKGVRSALIELLISISERQSNLIELHTRSIVLFIHSAMTHINPEIRNDSIKFLNILMDHGTDALVRSSWIKTLRCFFTLLNWTLNDSKQSVSLAITGNETSNTSTKSKQQILESLSNFITIGCFPKQDSNIKQEILTSHPLTHKYLIASNPQPFAQLKLFTKELTGNNKNTLDGTIDLSKIDCEDYATREKLLCEAFIPRMQKNLEPLIKEGGELGRNANSLNILTEKVVSHYNSVINEEL